MIVRILRLAGEDLLDRLVELADVLHLV